MQAPMQFNSDEVNPDLTKTSIDAMSSTQDVMQEKVWKDAMKEELSSIEKCGTWKLTQLPERNKSVDVKQIFKVKLSLEGTIVKHKARIMAMGFLQRQGMVYFELFTPVERYETVRLVMALACSRRWILARVDVKYAFLNGPFDEDVYVSQPLGFEVKGKRIWCIDYTRLCMVWMRHQEPGTGELMFSSSVMVLKDVQLSMVCMENTSKVKFY